MQLAPSLHKRTCTVPISTSDTTIAQQYYYIYGRICISLQQTSDVLILLGGGCPSFDVTQLLLLPWTGALFSAEALHLEVMRMQANVASSVTRI